MVGGNIGENLTQEMAEDLINRESPILQSSYPEIGMVGQPVTKNWTQDPFSKGSYSAMNINENVMLWNPSNNPFFEGMYQFAESMPDNTFIFARTRSSGHIEGAVQSGISAAKLLLTNTMSE
jgi:monoamine oxidase